MEIEQYINQKKQYYDNFRRFIENNNDTDEANYLNLVQVVEEQKILENREELKLFLKLILIISNNYHRYSGFFNKIKKILFNIKDNIKQTFSNLEIFNIFYHNKLIILFLCKNHILTIDQSIYDQIIAKKETDRNFFYYFYPEIKTFLTEEETKIIENKLLKENPKFFEKFEENRQIGENDSKICQIIRNDSIDEFISYVNETNLPLSSKIKPSIFETNSFLIKNQEPTLIEYAAFFKSAQIFKYLSDNKVELSPSLWLYAIHGHDTELIHLLEENKIDPPDMSYEKCFKESIKCHHNDVANYIMINFLKKEDELSINDNNFDDNYISYSFKYQNYLFMPKNFNNKFVFCYLCKYDYLTLVDILLKTEKSMINTTIKPILNLIWIHRIPSQFFEWNFKSKNFSYQILN